MKTITWDEFCGLIESLDIQIEIDGERPEIFYEENGSIKFYWEVDDFCYEYFVGGEDNEVISVEGNCIKVICRNENEEVSNMDIFLFSVQPYNI